MKKETTFIITLRPLLLMLLFAVVFNACKKENNQVVKKTNNESGIDFALGIDSISVSNEGRERTVAFSSDENWKAESKDKWITLLSTEGEKGDNTLKFSVSENIGEQRIGAISITSTSRDLSRDVVIVQDSLNGNPDIEITSATPISVTNKEGESGITFSTNVSWTAQTKDEWITLLLTAGKRGNNTIRFSVPDNKGDERTGAITILLPDGSLSKDIKIIQEATDNFYVKEGATGKGHSWDDATGLANALENSKEGSVISIAAGTYNPSKVITNGDPSDDRDNTFEVDKNVTIKGGYPANASGDVSPDPASYKTVLSGKLNGGEEAYHVVAITAPEISGRKVMMSGVTIRDGNSNGSGSFKVNGKDIFRANGGGLTVEGSNVKLIDVNIIDNKSEGGNTPGVYLREAQITFIRCKLNDNKTIGQAYGAVRSYNSNISMYDCEIKGNISTRATGIYAQYGTLYLYNTEIANNTASSWAPAIYLASAEGYIVNCLIHDNETTADGGGGLFIYKNNTHATIISSTIVNNKAINGGGIYMLNGTNQALSIYNSIISGNTQQK